MILLLFHAVKGDYVKSPGEYRRLEEWQMEFHRDTANKTLKILEALAFLIRGGKKELLYLEFHTSVSSCLIMNALKASVILG
jgi:hypothetical protein